MRRKIGDAVRVPRDVLDNRETDKTLVKCVVMDVHPGDPKKPARSYFVQPTGEYMEGRWVSAKRVAEAP
jgi:hypothetical protein